MGGKPGVDFRSAIGVWAVFLALLLAVMVGVWSGLGSPECGSVGTDGTISAVSSGEGGVLDEGRTTCR